MRTSTFLTLLAATTTPTVATHIIFVVADDLGFNDGMSPNQGWPALCATDSALRGVSAHSVLAPSTPTLVRY